MSLNEKEYLCEKCGTTKTVRKQYGIDYPEKLQCPQCKKKTLKPTFGNLGGTIVPEGDTGNAANGYSSAKNMTNKAALYKKASQNWRHPR